MANSLRRTGGAQGSRVGLPSDWSKRYSAPLLAQASRLAKYNRADLLLSDRERVAIYLDAINAGSLSTNSMLQISFGLRATAALWENMNVPKEMRDDHIVELSTAVNLPRSPVASGQDGRAILRLFNSYLHASSLISLRDELIVVFDVSLHHAKGGSIAYRTIATSQESAFKYALLLVVGNFSSDLCRCRLPSCGKFFLVEPVKIGRPRREYCSDEHREEFFRQQSGERVKRSRERAKARARKPK